jgi:(p)ppGpp synthase/HD superfamily hydrolase
MPHLSDKFRKALGYSFDLHADQVKKLSGVPYVGHLLSVAGSVLEHGGSEAQAIAALLHDAAEDQGGRRTLAKIEHRFGPVVADIVEDCTDSFEDPKPPWKERKRTFIRHLPRFPDETLIVCAADKLDNCRRTLTNLRAIGNDVWKTVSGGRERLWYYRSVVEAMAPRLQKIAPRLLDELEEAVSDLEKTAAKRGSRVAKRGKKKRR